MLFTVAIPPKPPNYSVQGLRQLHEQAQGKRPALFTIEFDAKKPRDQSAFYASLEEQIVEAVDALFFEGYSEWLSKYSAPLLRVRQLFLNDRDNLGLWQRIEQVVRQWIDGLGSEFAASFDLAALIRVQLNLRQKCTQLENALYWFNPLLGQSVESRCLELVESMVVTLGPQINSALVGLYLDPMFGEYFMPVHKFSDTGLMAELARSEWQRLPHSLGEFVAAFEHWRAESKLHWLRATGSGHGHPEGGESGHPMANKLSRQLEAGVLEIALAEFDIAAAVLEHPAAFKELTRYVAYYEDLLKKWSRCCRQALCALYGAVLELEPLARAAVLVEVMAVNNTHFNWVELYNGDPKSGDALALLAAADMASQRYDRIKVLGELLETMGDVQAFEDELGPFLETFGESLWRHLAPHVVGVDCKRFVHGLQLLGCPEALMNASVLVGLVAASGREIIVNGVYWPELRPVEVDSALLPAPEAARLATRSYVLDARSPCTVVVGGREQQTTLGELEASGSIY